MRTARISLMFCIMAALAACAFAPGFAGEKIVAVVNNEIITQRDLDSFLNFMRVQLSRQYSDSELEEKIKVMKQDLLDRLIEDRLILQEARKKNITVDDTRLRAKVEEVKRRYPSQRDFESALKEQGLVEADLVQRLREQQMTFALVEETIRAKIKVKPGEITEYYTSRREEFDIPEERVFQSLVGLEESVLQQAVAALRAGGCMEDAATNFALSLSAFSATKKDQLKKEVEDVLFSMQVNGISEPIKIKDSYYIFKLTGINLPRRLTLKEVQDKIQEILYERKMQEAMVQWIETLKKKAYIKKS